LQILDHATTPDTRSGPHRSIIMAVGLILGVILGAVRVLFLTLRPPHLP